MEYGGYVEVEKYSTARIKGQFGVEDTGRSERVSESILDTEDKGRMELRIQREEIERVARIQGEGSREYSWKRLDDIGRKE